MDVIGVCGAMVARKAWKRNLARFRIPVKAGMYVYDEITNDTPIGNWDSGANYIFANDDDIATFKSAKLNYQ